MDFETKRNIVADYIRQHPGCTYRDIKTSIKIKVERVFQNMTRAYQFAGVSFSKHLTRKDREKQRQDVISYIKEHEGCTVIDIQNSTRVCIPCVFGSILDAYRQANIPYPKKEITWGVRNPVVVKRCRDYESQVIQTLARLGKVRRHVRTPTGIVDCILTHGNKEFVVEVKDFRSRNNITMSQLKQLLKYMCALNIPNGLLVCPKESFPVRKNSRNIQVNDKNIRIFSLEDIDSMIHAYHQYGNAGI